MSQNFSRIGSQIEILRKAILLKSYTEFFEDVKFHSPEDNIRNQYPCEISITVALNHSLSDTSHNTLGMELMAYLTLVGLDASKLRYYGYKSYSLDYDDVTFDFGFRRNE